MNRYLIYRPYVGRWVASNGCYRAAFKTWREAPAWALRQADYEWRQRGNGVLP